MVEPNLGLRAVRAAHRAAAVALAAYLVVGLAGSDFMGPFLLLALAGGSLIAPILFALNAEPHGRLSLPDSFARDAFFTEMLNMSHVRVAGIGGLGLMLVSTAVTFQFPLVRSAVIAGLVGGMVAAAALISYRRRHGGPLVTAHAHSLI